MPKIPMSNKAGFIRHVSDTVHMQGAPGMNWGMEEGQALSNLGDQISRGANHLGNAVMAFGRHMQDTEDRLNATRIESLWKDRQSALEARMAANPAEYEKFGEWANETDSEFMDAAKPFRDKMSRSALELFDARMDGIRKETLNRRKLVGIQARVTNDYNLFQAQWKDAALRGDLETCNRLLDEHRGTLINQQEYERKKLDFDRLSDFGAAKAMLETVPPDQLIEQLKAKNDGGGYANFTHLPEDRREMFIRKAEAKQAMNEFKKIQEFNAGLVSGTLEVSQHDLDAKKADGLLNDREYLAMSATVNARDKELRRATSEKERMERSAKQRADAVNQSKFKLYVRMIDFSSNPEENAFQKKTALDALLKAFPGDYKYQAEMIDYIEKRSGEVELKRRIFSTPQGQIAKKWLETNVKQMYYDPWGLFNKESGTEFQMSRAAEASDLMADLLQHGKSADEAIRTVEEQVKRMNDGEIYHLYRWRTQVKKPKGKRITKADLERERNEITTASLLGYYVPPAPADHSKDILVEDIVSKKVNEYGREIWKLKDGRKVYADEYE